MLSRGALAILLIKLSTSLDFYISQCPHCRGTHFFLERRGVTVPRRYPGQENALDALEAVQEQGHVDVAARVIARCAGEGHRGREGPPLDRAEMVESVGTNVALLGAAEEEGVVAGHLVQHCRPVAGPGRQVAFGDQHDEPRRCPRDQSLGLRSTARSREILRSSRGDPEDNLKEGSEPLSPPTEFLARDFYIF